jgi:hypothetical protein
LIRPRFRNGRYRLAAGITAILSAVSLVGVLTASPALADDGSASLPSAQGHTCTIFYDSGTEQGDLCVELALYTTSSGEQFVTAQAEAFCHYDSGGYEPCYEAEVDATVANAGSPPYTDWTVMVCGVEYSESCQNIRNYFFPFGGLPISLGQCDNNVWAVIDVDASPVFVSSSPEPLPYFPNLETAHYNVCENSPGILTYS